MLSVSSFKFTPISLRPILWIEGNSFPGGGGESVGEIRDLSGNGNHVTQSSASLKPVFTKNAFEGNAAFAFDNSDDGMGTTATITTEWAIFVAEYIVTPGSRTVQSGTINCLISLSRNSGNSAFANTAVSDTFVTPGKVGVGCFKTGPTNLEYWVNGVNRTDYTVANQHWGTNIVFGAGWGAGGFMEPCSNNVLEVIIFNRFVTDHERAIVNAYLISKYGAVEGSL